MPLGLRVDKHIADLSSRSSRMPRSAICQDIGNVKATTKMSSSVDILYTLVPDHHHCLSYYFETPVSPSLPNIQNQAARGWRTCTFLLKLHGTMSHVRKDSIQPVHTLNLVSFFPVQFENSHDRLLMQTENMLIRLHIMTHNPIRVFAVRTKYIVPFPMHGPTTRKNIPKVARVLTFLQIPQKQIYFILFLEVNSIHI